MKTRAKAAWILVSVLMAGTADAQPVHLSFLMPNYTFSPGALCYLRLNVQNSGPPLASAQLYVALDIGTGDYWFYPSWVHYPPNLDWLDTAVAAGNDQWEIITPFTWPGGCGSGSVQALSAVLAGGVLMSDIAAATFSWYEEPPPVFLPIPPGTFTMGAPPSELCSSSDETQHSVILSHGLYIQQTEVTQAQWVAVFGQHPSPYGGLGRPADLVTWYDCCIYCNRLSQAQGLWPCYYADASYSTVFDGTPPVTGGLVYWDQTAPGYRLPTESEWEYACRAGTTTAYNSGASNTACTGQDPPLDALAWYHFNSPSQSQAVGLKLANAWSLYDMHGNLWEWCWDLYGIYPGGPVTDPTGPATGLNRIVRGGTWDHEPASCRSARRFPQDPGTSDFYAGFRPVRNAP